MIAVVYSGSRYADWKLAEKGRIVSEFKTPGINPFFSDEEHIVNLLDKSIELINNAEKIHRVYFFGAGASSKERQDLITKALGGFFRFSKIIVEHDLKAAALAACGDEKGIIGILGSGSNAAYFDGKKISNNNFGLGYILGDEGSANWLGRRLLKSFLNDLMPEDFVEKFSKKYDLDRTQILDKVYRKAEPALYLSSFADFLMDNQYHPFVKKLVKEGFDLYIKTYLKPLVEKHPSINIHMLGTVAAGFDDCLMEVAAQNNIYISSIIKEPIYNLLKYYANKN
jgi:N-acetylglucosamine kinase-like BadF-type ATPase